MVNSRGLLREFCVLTGHDNPVEVIWAYHSPAGMIDTALAIQDFSHMPTIVEAKINPDPHLKKLYAAILSEFRTLGKVKIEEKQTSVHVKAKSAFAGIHARKDHLILQIVTDTPIESPRVFKIEKVSANRVHNHIRIESEKNVNRELRMWLARSYALMG